ncbi:hypothetical protein [Alteromonas gilva]|uniref:Integral membrane protein n=1 Tax=Alteromonas gilva TaxID=2987522 RepID=A0ABT5KWT8_9ALTE|nr:hypothetical protein [Alteromonas gilva]MDC8829229.1 hypothetical protein [Alteromonas gilva]
MNDESTDLTALWQQQPVSNIDMADLTKRLKRQQRLQRLYVITDFMCLFMSIGFIAYTWNSLPSVLIYMLFGVSGSALAMTVYFVWLRRHAALATFEDTAQFRETLKKQLRNNQTIARVTFHSGWVSIVMLLTIFGVLVYSGEMSMDKLVSKLPVIAGLCVLMAGFMPWAYQRERKFKAEYQQLIEQE